MRLVPNTAADFWSKVRRTDTCWLWEAQITRSGYGSFSMDGRKRLAHRLAYELTHGPIPPGLCVCHRCDVRHCVNPAHLFLGTVGDNQRDAQRKGRLHGANRPATRLSSEEVASIRREYVPGKVGYQRLARRYGVANRTIYQIVNRLTWKETCDPSRETSASA
jgi:hypothetical protein